MTSTGWEVYPEGLTETLLRVTERYGKVPIYVTENGAAYDDPAPEIDGVVEDPRRVAYLRDHLAATQAAIEQGADVRGYFVWSLLDNFEWQNGYSQALRHRPRGLRHRRSARSSAARSSIVT